MKAASFLLFVDVKPNIARQHIIKRLSPNRLGTGITNNIKLRKEERPEMKDCNNFIAVVMEQAKKLQEERKWAFELRRAPLYMSRSFKQESCIKRKRACTIYVFGDIEKNSFENKKAVKAFFREKGKRGNEDFQQCSNQKCREKSSRYFVDECPISEEQANNFW